MIFFLWKKSFFGGKNPFFFENFNISRNNIINIQVAKVLHLQDYNLAAMSSAMQLNK